MSRYLSLGCVLCLLSCGAATGLDRYEHDASLTPEDARCTPGTSTACVCSEGGVGARRCLGDSTYDRCQCADGGLVEDIGVDSGFEPAPDVFVDAGPVLCALGSTAICTCPDGSVGTKHCRSDGAFDPCVCAGADSGVASDGGTPGDAAASDACGIVETERCDGRDNDCDGVIDNGEVCPSSSLGPTDPFSGGVYFLGTTWRGACGYDAIQRFWPTVSTTYYSGFACLDEWFLFRRRDNSLYYISPDGLRKDVPTGVDPIVPTPPCTNSAGLGPRFDFDGAGTLHYSCEGLLRRGSGELVTTDLRSFVGTLSDGRLLVTRASKSIKDREDYVILGKDGVEESRLAPHPFFVGTLHPDPLSASISGNRAYVLFFRELPDGTKELVSFRFDGSIWSRVRRAAYDGPSAASARGRLVISDGTIFVQEVEPLTRGEHRIRLLRADGTWTTVWREVEAKVVRLHGHDQLLVGPP